jgi:hypothetical protein
MLPVNVKEPDITGGACIDIEPVSIALCITIIVYCYVVIFLLVCRFLLLVLGLFVVVLVFALFFVVI